MTDSRVAIDPELVRRFTEDDQDAFAAIFRQSAQHSYRLALRITGQPAAAEDIVQDTFVRLWEARKRVNAKEEEIYIVINHSREEKRVPLPWPAREHLSGEVGKGDLILAPYGVAVLTAVS